MVELLDDVTGYPQRRQKGYHLGIPRAVVTTRPSSAQFDEFLIVATPTTIKLPTISLKNVGQTVAICNVSGSPSVYIAAAGGTIDNLYSRVRAHEYVVTVLVAVAPGMWISVNNSAGRWDDLRFPVTGITPPGAASDPARNTTTGLLEFSKSATNTIAGVVQLPHRWVAGSELRPHIHHSASTATDPAAGNPYVVWQLEYRWYNANDVVPVSYTADAQVFLLADLVDGRPVAQAGVFTPIDGSGYRDSSILEWKLSRLGASGGDTYDDVDTLAEFDIHILQDSLGSWDEYPGA